MLHFEFLLKQVIEIVPNPNLQSPTAKETAGAAVQPAAQTQKSANHSMPQQPPQHRPPVSVHQISREEHQIMARERAKQQEPRARMEQQHRLERMDHVQMEKTVQHRLEQAHREQHQLHQQQQQHQRIQRGREVTEVQHQQPPAQPRDSLPLHMRAEQMAPYARLDGFGPQVSPLARVPTPQQHPEVHPEKKGKLISLFQCKG